MMMQLEKTERRTAAVMYFILNVEKGTEINE